MLIASPPHPSTPLRSTPSDSMRPTSPTPSSFSCTGQSLQLVRICTLDPKRCTGRQTRETRHPKPPIHHPLSDHPWLPCWAPCRQPQWPCLSLGVKGEQRGFTGSRGGWEWRSQPLHTKHSKAALHVLNSNPWRIAPKKDGCRRERPGWGQGRDSGAQLKSFCKFSVP